VGEHENSQYLLSLWESTWILRYLSKIIGKEANVQDPVEQTFFFLDHAKDLRVLPVEQA